MPLKTQLQEGFYRWALRGKRRETPPILLDQHRIYVLPSGQGLAFGGMLVLMLIGAMNYSLSLGYALVFLFAGLGTVTILHTFRNLAHLRLLTGRCPPVFAGEMAAFGLTLDNTRQQPRCAIRLNLPGQPACEYDLPAASAQHLFLEYPAPQRGWLDLPRVTLASTWPLGLVRAWGYATPELRCLIYPAPATQPPALPMPPGNTGEGGHASEGQDDFSGLRAHHPGDPLRHVAWKAVARQEDGPLLTKQFTRSAALTLWLDWNALPPGNDTEQCLSILTRWVCDAHANHMTWGLRLPSLILPPASGDEHFHTCLRHLALYGAH
ncbi:MAG: DUF58 domain-containing protein [Sterolibacterium sp.]|jgi:uncharacterized protein (DUF58 family)|nr:DUF58 domain-containing protein [Sterolibacterium sp.]